MAAGDFINVYNEQIAAQLMWNDPRNLRELQKPIKTAEAVLFEQGVRFLPIMKGNRCVGVEAIYLKSCNTDVVDCEEGANDIADCGVSGVEAEGVKKTYTPNVCLKKSIKVSADDCAGFNSFEEKLAFLKLQAKTQLEVELNDKLVSTIASNAQVNAHPMGGTVSGTKVLFGAGNWEDGNGAKLIPKLHVSAERSELYSAYILNGINFYEAKWLYEYKEKAGSDDRYDNVFMSGPYPMYWDITNLDSVLSSAGSTFMIDKAAIAFFGQNEYQDARQMLKSDLYTYTEPSMRLSYRDGNAMVPVKFDVTEEWTCAVGSADPNRSKRYQVVELEFVLRGGIITGPPDCAGGTGILHFEQN